MSDDIGTALGQVRMHINDALSGAKTEFQMVQVSVDPDEFDYDGFTPHFITTANENQKKLVDACRDEGHERCSADPLTTILWRISQRDDWRKHRYPLTYELAKLNAEKS